MNATLSALLLNHSHFSVMVILILCGVGLPIPEEVILIGGGWSVFENKTEVVGLWLMILTATVAILCGDSITFWLGRHFGPDLLKTRWVRKFLTPRRVHRAHLAFEKHGWKAVFFGRFVAGLRLGTYFIAGTLRMRWWLFLLLDFLGCIISVPISVWLGWHFGGEIQQAIRWSHDIRDVLMIVVAAVALAWFAVWLHRRRTAIPVPLKVVIDEVLSTPLASRRQRALDQRATNRDGPTDAPAAE